MLETMDGTPMTWATGQRRPITSLAAGALRMQINGRLSRVRAAILNRQAADWCCLAASALYPQPCPYGHSQVTRR